MYIASLLSSVLANMNDAPLHHDQGRLVPVRDVIPDWSIDGIDKPDRLHGFEKRRRLLDWRFLGERFTIVLTGKYVDDERSLRKKLFDAVSAIQVRTNVAIQQFDGELIMLPWADKMYRQGWGDYDSYSGGYGSLTDPRTGNLFCLFIRSQKQDHQHTADVVAKTEAVFEISFHFALVPLDWKTDDQDAIKTKQA